MNINNRIGPPVEGDDFFGREKELKLAKQYLSKGNSLKLAAPRRVGKSSFSKKLLEEFAKQEWKTLYIDLEEVRTEEMFVKLFIEKLQETNWWKAKAATLETIATQILESVNVTVGGVSIGWKTKRGDVYNKLKKLLDHERDTLIVVDELTIFLNNLIKNENGIEDVEFFLNWLRSFRQIKSTKIRWIFCSSISIDNFTNRYSLSYTLNDTSSFEIEGFTGAEAKGLIKMLATSDNILFPEEAIQHMLDKLVWHLPFFIQLLFSRIIAIHESGEITLQLIDDAYTKLIEGKEFNPWSERLKDYSPNDIHARAILKHLSENHEGESRENLANILYLKITDEEQMNEVLTWLLEVLTHDGYIICSAGKYRFRSPLLRDFWYNKFVR